MNKGMKYITFYDHLHFGMPTINIFSMTHKHVDMAKVLMILNKHLIGAGFIRIEDGKLVCHGESIGLGIKMAEGDTKLANEILGL